MRDAHRSAPVLTRRTALAAVAAGLAAVATGHAARAAEAVRAGDDTGRVLRLPRPTGPYRVGVRSASVADPARLDEQTGRPRRLPIRVWYPAAHAGSGPQAAYYSPAVRGYLEQNLGLPPGWLEVDPHAWPDVPVRRPLRGVVVVQHGGGTLAAFQTGQVVELASRGHAVVTMEHPHESFVVEEPDGTLIVGADPETRPFSERVLDAAVVLDSLPRLVPEAGRRPAVAMIGHSRGGAAAAEVMLHRADVLAGVDLDGSPRGEVLAAGLGRPFGLALSADQPIEGNPLLQGFLAVLRGPHPVLQLDVRHYGYTDWVVFNPQAARAVPAIGAALEANLPAGTVADLRAGYEALAAQRQFLNRFLDRYLAT